MLGRFVMRLGRWIGGMSIEVRRPGSADSISTWYLTIADPCLEVLGNVHGQTVPVSGDQ